MELIKYINLIRRWLWLIILASFLTGSIAYVTGKRQERTVYQTQALLSIGNFANSPDPDTAEIFIGRELVKTYIILTTTHDVLQATVDALDIEMSVAQLRGAVIATPVEGTSLMQLGITNPDRVKAADIANELAHQIILHSPTNLTPEQERRIDLANTQVERLNNQLEGLHLQLEEVDRQIATITDDDELERLTLQRNILIDQINGATTTVAQYSFTVLNLQRQTNSVEIIERAQVPLAPVQNPLLPRVLLATLVGASMAVGLALTIEYMDNTVKTSAQAAELLKTSVWGTIQYNHKYHKRYPRKALTDPLANEVLEAYHTLRTNILLANNEGQHVYVMTSPGPAEGKSSVTANLAIAMAQNGKRVLLVDADLRRPTIHTLFGLPNEFGLNTLLQDIAPEEGATNTTEQVFATRMTHCVQQTTTPNLVVITSGSSSGQSPSILLGSPMMQQWYKSVRAISQLDVVLFDTPPSLMFADGSALAANTGANVILVLEAGRTQEQAALKVVETFNEQHIEVKGLVLNKAKPRDEEYYYYGYRYYYTSAAEPPHRRLLDRITGKQNDQQH